MCSEKRRTGRSLLGAVRWLSQAGLRGRFSHARSGGLVGTRDGRPSQNEAKILALLQRSSQKVGKSSYSAIWTLTLNRFFRIRLAVLKYLLLPTAYSRNVRMPDQSVGKYSTDGTRQAWIKGPRARSW